jgi:hypothetical protein
MVIISTKSDFFFFNVINRAKPDQTKREPIQQEQETQENKPQSELKSIGNMKLELRTRMGNL